MSTISLTDQVEEYLAEVKRKRSPATRYLYSNVLERIFLPWAKSEGITKSADMNDKALDKWTAYLQARKRTGNEKKPLSKDTVRSYIRYVRIFLGWADVPRGKFQAPSKPPRRLRDTLSREEIQKMEDTATDERDRLVVRVLADTGVRIGELLGLRPQDLRAHEHLRHYFIRVVGKGNIEREVAIPGPVFKRLKHHAEVNRHEYIFCGKRRRPNGQIERLTKSGAEQLIRNLAIRAGITRRVWPHLFRYSYISHMRRKGVDAIDVMRSVGHKDLSMISEIYDQTTPDDSHDALIKALRA
jgi:site-specific recombinase XerD